MGSRPTRLSVSPCPATSDRTSGCAPRSNGCSLAARGPSCVHIRYTDRKVSLDRIATEVAGCGNASPRRRSSLPPTTSGCRSGSGRDFSEVFVIDKVLGDDANRSTSVSWWMILAEAENALADIEALVDTLPSCAPGVPRSRWPQRSSRRSKIGSATSTAGTRAWCSNAGSRPGRDPHDARLRR